MGFAVFAVAGGEEHAVGLEAAHLAGGEVGDDYYAAADELFGGVPLRYAGEDLALFGAEVDFETEELVGLGDALGYDDFGYAEIDFGEVVDGDVRGCRGGFVGCGCGLGVVLGDGVKMLGGRVERRSGGERGDGGLAELGLGAGRGVAVVGDVRQGYG